MRGHTNFHACTFLRPFIKEKRFFLRGPLLETLNLLFRISIIIIIFFNNNNNNDYNDNNNGLVVYATVYATVAFDFTEQSEVIYCQ